jgi:hypothetical protein
MSDDAPFSDDYYDSDRYDTADGWEPPDPYKKLREKAREKDELIGPWNSMVEVCSADEVLRSNGRGEDDEAPAKKGPPGDLFGPLWREGELAVLAAETGVGKSILATQIAASIAKGQRIEPFRSPGSPPYEGGVDAALRGRRGGSLRSRGRPVLYIDLERSTNQFRERYSIRSPKGRLRRHTFGPNFIYVPIRDFGEPPPAFKRDLDKYLLHSIRWAIGETDARVIVIDNISYLASARGGPARLMKTLKLWTMHGGLSILAITHCKQKVSIQKSVVSNRTFRTPHSAFRICDAISQNADTIFAIGRSTMSREVRYIKHLKSNNLPATLNGPTVATFRIERMESGKLKMENADPVGTLATETTEPTESPSSSLTPHSALRIPQSEHSALRNPHSEGPFIGFQFLGFSPEESHLIDYAAEARAVRTASDSDRVKRLRSGSVVDMVLSPEYQRYLKGE